jgi:hypothetical protein
MPNELQECSSQEERATGDRFLSALCMMAPNEEVIDWISRTPGAGLLKSLITVLRDALSVQ